ncbi:hypothetical protein [Acinetobacter baumannii]|uniref:hypothetical protein n=1 Tax=Acinetobacter baumannii TaxID=470 RepID=UPI000D021B7D|nr:hypothetical protein [Acinetobacter baumannii]PRN10724.1 hypothetical protein B9W54_13120 [Acinetobacter baumannii]PRN30612.1 hypothetical protein B9W49_11880 [Acinetobacter baumannii]PRN69038.1 hypothetical protein B9W42_12100 [Acinetobacter baumannii]
MNYYLFLVDSRFLLRMSKELMKDWIYFYIEHTIKYGEPFYKEIGKLAPLIFRPNASFNATSYD